MSPTTEKRLDYSSDIVSSPVMGIDTGFLDSDHWREWDKTGFKLRQQIKKLTLDYSHKTSEGKSPRVAILEWMQETSEDVEAFWFEYICQNLVLPIRLEKKIINGERQLVAPRYNSKTLVELTIAEERNGALKEGIEKLTEFITSAPQNSMAILISPSGWSGLKNDTGEKIVYTETQIYLYKTDIFGKVEAVTVRVDNALRQNRVLHSILSGNQFPTTESSSDQLTIQQIVGNPILINGAEFQIDFEDVIKTIEQNKGSKYALRERTFDELWEHFRNRHIISQLQEQANYQEDNEKAKTVISNFQRFIEKFEYLSTEFLEEITIEMGNTLRKLYRIKNQPRSSWRLDNFAQSALDREMANIQKLLGCTGVSSNSESMFTTFGFKTHSTESGLNFVHCGKAGCPHAKEGSFKKGQPVCEHAISRN